MVTLGDIEHEAVGGSGGGTSVVREVGSIVAVVILHHPFSQQYPGAQSASHVH
jgi:hypothetical protein